MRTAKSLKYKCHLKARKLRNSNSHNYLSMSSEEAPSSVIFRGSFDEMNFKIFSLLPSDGSKIHKLTLWAFHYVFNVLP